MAELDDSTLLRQYVESSSEAAFAELVERHLSLVYSVASRSVNHPQAAEEITQAVFIILARKAKSLGGRTVLAGWLYQTARLTAANFLRGEIRRQRREQEVSMQSVLEEPATDDTWRQIAPLLEDAMGWLGKNDRNALVLRFFEDKSLAEVGVALGTTEDAAKMRVNRALEKLRRFFGKHGINSATAIIAREISANSVHAAPVGLAQMISAVALAKGAVASTSTLTLVKGVLKIMAWTKTKTAIMVGAGILLAAGTTTVTVKEVHWHQNTEWQLGEISSKYLLKPPYRTVILPTRSAERSRRNGTGGAASMGDGRLYGVNASVADILRWAFPDGRNVLSPARTVHATGLTTNRYDYFSNLPQGSREALQREIRNWFGLVGRFETIDTNILSLRIRATGAHGLLPSTSSAGSSSFGNGSMSVVNETMDDLAFSLEMSLGIPVVNQTGLTNAFDFKLSWGNYADDNPDPDALKQALTEQLGLELVPARAPVKMLVVEKAGK
jgi:uncharacterized protein (TIGR03435 family)